MPHCTKCGTEVAPNVAFCPSCGQAQAGAAPGGAPVTSGSQSGLQENLAGALCYAFGWITGIIFFLIDKRPFVRFHAAQSIVVFGGLHIIQIVLGIVWGGGMFFGGGWTGFGLSWALHSLISLVTFVLWIVLIIMAAQNKKFRVPVAADIADSFAK